MILLLKLQPILNKSAFGQIFLEAPCLEVQRKVSAALHPLDDRITLLRETNATLEAIAQALFKSWFVDFDPVRGNRFIRFSFAVSEQEIERAIERMVPAFALTV